MAAIVAGVVSDLAACLAPIIEKYRGNGNTCN
jgi:hypothetical protein